MNTINAINDTPTIANDELHIGISSDFDYADDTGGIDTFCMLVENADDTLFEIWSDVVDNEIGMLEFIYDNKHSHLFEDLSGFKSWLYSFIRETFEFKSFSDPEDISPLLVIISEYVEHNLWRF